MPAISIIMPAYNTEAYITESIESVLHQSFKDWELLIIDDGSPDNLAEIAKKYSQQHANIHLFQQKNAGVSVARNLGISKAQGKYICFLDSDDLYLESFLEKLHTRAENTPADLTYSGFIKEKKNRHLPIGHPYSEGFLLTKYLNGKQPISIATALFSHKFINQRDLTFTPGCKIAEDFEFLVKALVTAKCATIPEELYLYKHRLDSTTKSTSKMITREDSLKVVLRLKKYLNQKHFTPNIRKHHEIFDPSATLYSIAWTALKEQDFDFIHHLLEKYPTYLQKGNYKKFIINSKNFTLWKIASSVYQIISVFK